MERDDPPNAEPVITAVPVIPILVTHAGVGHGDLSDQFARSAVISLQHEVNASLASLLPQILAEGGQVQVDIPLGYGDADVWVYGLSPALTEAVFACL